MKKAELVFGAILVPIDYLMLVAAGLTAYFLRFSTSVSDLQEVTYEIPYDLYVRSTIVTALGWLVIFAFTGLYRIKGTRRVVDEIRKIFLACSTGVLAIMVAFFFERDLFSSRFIILAAYVLSFVFVMAARLVVLGIERTLFKRGVGVHNVVVIGDGHVSKVVTTEFQHNRSLGFHVKAIFDHFSSEAAEKILQYKEKGFVDELVLAEPNISREQSEKIYEFCDEHHLTFKYAAAVFDAQLSNISISPVGGIPIIEVQKTRLEGWGRIAKRLFDLVGSAILIILTSPIMLLTAIAIVIDSGLPVFFSRKDDGTKVKRVGQQGKPFVYFKFRSMKPKTDSLRYGEQLQEKNLRKGTPLVKIKDDPRVTRVGKFIRRTSLDEFPELFLVFRGDMSLVGPRPHLPEEVAHYQKHHKRVLNMKPGMTGMAQVTGRSDLEFEDEVRLDTYYMENWSMLLDLILLIKTPLAVFKKREAL